MCYNKKVFSQGGKEVVKKGRVMVRKVGLTDSVGFACLEDLQLSNSYMWGTAISLDYCGREDCIKGWKFGPYVRESYVIHIVKKGKEPVKKAVEARKEEPGYEQLSLFGLAGI